MKEPELLEVIDQYLMGNIRPEAKAELEHLMASDPGIRELVNDSREAFRVLQSARTRHLRERLRELDKKNNRPSGFLPRWFVLIAGILIVMGGTWYWAYRHFSNESIALRYYQMTDPAVEVFNGEMKIMWEETNVAFRNKDYSRAFTLYQSMLVNPQLSDPYTVRWHLLLADLALHGQTMEWKNSLEAFAEEAPFPISTRAHELSRFLSSGWYKMMVRCTQTDISGLKPRLI